MSVPRHPGSRVVPHPPDLVRIVQQLRAEIRRVRPRPETLTFVAVTGGVPATAASLTATHLTQVYRSGEAVFADVLASAGAGSVVEVALAIPALSAVGPAVATPAGGDHVLRVTLDAPSGWAAGAPAMVQVQARRASGGDSTTVRVLRAWQR